MRKSLVSGMLKDPNKGRVPLKCRWGIVGKEIETLSQNKDIGFLEPTIEVYGFINIISLSLIHI